jgi:hypothetical protein
MWLKLLVRMSPFVLFAEIRQFPDFPQKDMIGHFKLVRFRFSKYLGILHIYVSYISKYATLHCEFLHVILMCEGSR